MKQVQAEKTTRGFQLPLADVFWVGALTCSFFVLGSLESVLPDGGKLVPPSRLDLLGAEYDSIARAIRDGTGFADPFDAGTGPTAWMAPALPYLISSLYALTSDNRDQVVAIVIFLQALVVFSTGLMTVSIARWHGCRAAGYVVVVLGFFAQFYWLFQRTHDVWLLLLVFNLIWLGVTKGWADARHHDAKRAMVWGAAGGLFALCSPVAGFVWAMMTLRSSLFQGAPVSRRSLAMLLVVVTSSMAVVTPWTIRNRLVLGVWIPIKSNAIYEAWQAQCVDDDGVLDSETFTRHPWSMHGTKHRQDYVKLGEIQFVRQFGEPLVKSLSTSSAEFLQRVANRFVSAVIQPTPLVESHNDKLIMRVSRLLYILPLAGLVAITWACPSQFRTEADSAVAITMLGLAPYILISYYARYAAPLAGMQMLLMLFGYVACKEYFIQWRNKARTDGNAKTHSP